MTSSGEIPQNSCVGGSFVEVSSDLRVAFLESPLSFDVSKCKHYKSSVLLLVCSSVAAQHQTLLLKEGRTPEKATFSISMHLNASRCPQMHHRPESTKTCRMCVSKWLLLAKLPAIHHSFPPIQDAPIQDELFPCERVAYRYFSTQTGNRRHAVPILGRGSLLLRVTIQILVTSLCEGKHKNPPPSLP